MKQENQDVRRVKRAPAPTATPETETTVTGMNTTKQPETSTNNSVKEPQRTSAASTVKQDTFEKSVETENARQTSFEQNVTTNTPHKSNVSDEATVSGEVESKVNESTMLDSEDNYTDGFDFVEEDVAFTQTSAASDVFTDEPVTGEVENKIDESTMLDSEDNYDSGFDFVEEDTGSSVFISDTDEEETYSGEVEDKINESTMLDSEDNYTDGFDFIVGNEQEEEIPTISGGQTSLNLDPFGENNSASNDDVLVGDVEDKLDESTLLGNDDDAEEGFNFL